MSSERLLDSKFHNFLTCNEALKCRYLSKNPNVVVVCTKFELKMPILMPTEQNSPIRMLSKASYLETILFGGMVEHVLSHGLSPVKKYI